MKHIFKIFLLTFLSLNVLTLWGQEVNVTAWPATPPQLTQSSFTGTTWPYGVLAEDVTLSMTGTCTMTGTIVIPSGRTLTIGVSDDNNDCYILASMSSFTATGFVEGSSMFKVESGGKLIINGPAADKKYIRLKGAEDAMKSVLVPPDGDKKYLESLDYTKKSQGDVDRNYIDFSGALISSSGTLYLTKVQIYDAYSTNIGAAVMIPSASKNSEVISYGPTTLKNCIINRCYASGGAALMVWDQKRNDQPVTALADCKVILDKVQIYNNYNYKVDDSSRGGVIRSAQQAVSIVDIRNSYIYSNTSETQGAGIYWVAKGHTDTKLILNSVKLHHNKSLAQGGGIVVRNGGRMVFEGGISEIYSNIAETNGGGIWGHTTDLVLNEYAYIHDNVTKKGSGGGVVMSTSTNLTVAGARITANQSAATGGGLVLADTAQAVIEDCEISGNTAATTGGGLVLTDTAQAVIEDCEISGNTATSYGGGVYMEKTAKLTINGGVISSNIADTNGGAIYATTAANTPDDQGSYSIQINGGRIEGNKALRGGGLFVIRRNILSQKQTGDPVVIADNEAQEGGGIFLTAGHLQMTAGSLTGNKANLVDVGKGGACYLNSATATFTNCTLSSNVASKVGGGVYAAAAGSSVNISSGCVVTTNSAGESGGGIFMSSSGGNLTIEGGEISHNEAETHYGGGVCVSPGTLNVSGGDIVYNTANRGGGLSILAGNSTISGGNIKYNSVYLIQEQDNKGGYGGGVFVGYDATTTQEVGHLTMTGGVISDNTAEDRGGGLYAHNSVEYMATKPQNIVVSSGDIRNNTSYIGAGVFMGHNNFTFAGGNITENLSTGRGGGVAALDAVFDMNGGTIADNKALTAGGVYLINGAEMRIGGGSLVNNRALINVDSSSSNEVSFTTAKGNASGLLGVGGGVFLDNGVSAQDPTSLVFDGAKGSFSLYNNIAEVAAKDIYANGTYTSVTLPEVDDMSLAGYGSNTSELYWVEDYMAGDTAYPDLTGVAPDGYSPVRYDDAVAEKSTAYRLEWGEPITGYLCSALGREVIFINLIRTGLVKGENAIFRISRYDEGQGKWIVYSEMMLYGPVDATAENASQKSSTKVIAIYSGIWRIEELGWAWTYTGETFIEKNVNSASSADDRSFVFRRSKKTEDDPDVVFVPASQYGETVVTNDFGIGNVTVGKSAPESSTSFETIEQNDIRW